MEAWEEGIKGDGEMKGKKECVASSDVPILSRRAGSGFGLSRAEPKVDVETKKLAGSGETDVPVTWFVFLLFRPKTASKWHRRGQ